MSDSEIGEEIDEDTYSTIFAALKHPIRRRILRMLSEKPSSFTEILNMLSINSAQLSFHVKSLRELTTQTESDKYALSVFGKAACSLMGKVEETATRIPGKMIEFKWALIVFLVVELLPIVIYTPGPLPRSSWTFSIGGLIGLLILIWQYRRAPSRSADSLEG